MNLSAVISLENIIPTIRVVILVCVQFRIERHVTILFVYPSYNLHLILNVLITIWNYYLLN